MPFRSAIALLGLTLISFSVAATDFERYLLHVDPSQKNQIVEDLVRREDVVDVRVLFGEQILVTTSAGDLATSLQSSVRIHRERVASPLAIGYAGPLARHATEGKLRPGLAYERQSAAMTNDPMNVFQWAYANRGFELGIVDVDTGVSSIPYTGEGSIIAIATTGADYTHEDLQGALWVNDREIGSNGIDDDANGHVDDIYGPGPAGSGDTMDRVGSGTALAGIIAARRDNGKGISGIAPGAKVLACNAATPTGQLAIFDVLLCIDYVIDQKLNRGQRIDVFVAGFRGFSPFDQLIEPAMRALQDADILVVAASYMVPPGLYASQDLDVSTDAPATMDFANILAVAAVDRAGKMAFKTFGARTIDTSLPGVEILTTLPGFLGDIDGSGYIDEGFETQPGGWAFGGGWQYVADGGKAASGGLVLDVGSGDLFSEDQVVLFPAVDVSSIAGASPWVSFDLWTENMVDDDDLPVEAWVDLEWYNETQQQWLTLKSNNDYKEGPAWQKIVGHMDPYSVSQADLALLKLRIVARTRVAHSPTIRLDNIKVGPEPARQGNSNNYRYYNGTGPAAAFAAATVAILREENPAISSSELKNLLMNSGRPLQNVLDWGDTDVELTVSNKIAQIWNSTGTGALQCFDQLTNRRVFPIWARLNTVHLAVGQTLRVDSLSSNCAAPGVAPFLTEQFGGRVIEMSDNGLGRDQVASDGLFVAEWSPSTPAKDVLDISNDDQISAYALAHYETEERPFQWRELVAEPEYPSSHQFEPPFPIYFGGLQNGGGITHEIYVGHNPGLAFDRWFVDAATGVMIPDSPGTIWNEPTIGPLVGRFQLVPFWAEHNLSSPALGWNVPQPEVQGEPPNREWIIEWADYSFDDCEADNVSMQMVVFENSPDILVSFKETAQDCSGNSPRIMLSHNFDSWQLFDIEIEAPMSILMRPKINDSNSAPEIVAEIPEQTAVHGESLTLDLSSYFRDPEGDALYFFLGRDSSFVNVTSEGMLTARFPYHGPADLPTSIIEVGAHDGRLATRTRFEVSFDNSSNEPPYQVQTLPVFQAVAGEIISIDLLQYFDDPDGDPLEILDSSNDLELLRVHDGRHLVLNAGFEGQSDTREFMVTDGGYAVPFTVSAVAVDVADTAPVLVTPIPDYNVRVGEYLRIPVNRYFATDEWARINYQTSHVEIVDILGEPPVLHVFIEDPSLAGDSYDVVVHARRSGSNLETTDSFTLRILPENRGPELTATLPIQVVRNQQVEIRLSEIVADPNGDPVFFVVKDLPMGLQEPVPGVVSGEFAETGQYAFQVRATDALGASLLASVGVTVSANAPPAGGGSGGGSGPDAGGGGGGGSTGPVVAILILLFIVRALISAEVRERGGWRRCR